MAEILKPLEFAGSSLVDLRAFPTDARQRAGYELDRVQRGENPADWKPMQSIGNGVREIRVRGEDGAFRVMYVARFSRAIFILHCFQKKTQKTGKLDIEIAKQRYRELEP